MQAQVWTVNGFSAHADQPILLDWLKKADPEHLFLVHGEGEVLKDFKQTIAETLDIAVWQKSVEV